MKNEDVKIEKVVLNVGGGKINLSVEQAKKLKGILDELFGKGIITEVVENHYYRDWYYRPYQVLTIIPITVPDNNKFYCSNNTLNLTV